MYLNHLLKHTAIFNKRLILMLFIFFFSLNSISYSQTIQVINTSQNEDKISISLLSTVESFVHKTGDNNYFDYDYSMDENTPGKPIVPSRVFIVAIPPNSEVSVEIKNRVDNYFENARLNINPKVTLNPDSTLNYQDVDISADYLTNHLLQTGN